MEVFPTDWSPKKTSLYFARGARDVVPVMGRLAAGALVSLIFQFVFFYYNPGEIMQLIDDQQRGR